MINNAVLYYFAAVFFGGITIFATGWIACLKTYEKHIQKQEVEYQ